MGFSSARDLKISTSFEPDIKVTFLVFRSHFLKGPSKKAFFPVPVWNFLTM
jgi:hypothetical protein